MKESLITGVCQAPAGGWLVELDCGHRRPPPTEPPADATPQSLSSYQAALADLVGSRAWCPTCNEAAPLSYDDARRAGLCREGAEEADR